MVIPLIIAGVGVAASLALQYFQGLPQNKPTQVFVTNAPSIKTNYSPFILAAIAIFIVLMVIKR